MVAVSVIATGAAERIFSLRRNVSTILAEQFINGAHVSTNNMDLIDRPGVAGTHTYGFYGRRSPSGGAAYFFHPGSAPGYQQILSCYELVVAV